MGIIPQLAEVSGSQQGANGSIATVNFPLVLWVGGGRCPHISAALSIIGERGQNPPTHLGLRSNQFPEQGSSGLAAHPLPPPLLRGDGFHRGVVSDSPRKIHWVHLSQLKPSEKQEQFCFCSPSSSQFPKPFASSVPFS